MLSAGTDFILKPAVMRALGFNFQDKFLQYWPSKLAGFFNSGYIVRSLLSKHASPAHELEPLNNNKISGREVLTIEVNP